MDFSFELNVMFRYIKKKIISNIIHLLFYDNLYKYIYIILLKFNSVYVGTLLIFKFFN